MSKHTPGLWSVHKANGKTMVVSKGQGAEPSMLYLAWSISVAPSQGDTEANMRLMAAAPELLDALKDLIACDSDERINAAIAAIAKAEGALL